MLHDRAFRVVIDDGRGWGFRLPVGGTLLPDLGVDFLELRAAVLSVSERYRYLGNAMTYFFQ